MAVRFVIGRDPAEPEHRLLLTARTVKLRSLDGRPPRGSLGEGARALALVPILDQLGEVSGWVHLECEHLLLPSTARLAALAAVHGANTLLAQSGLEALRLAVPRSTGQSHRVSR